MVSDCRRRSHRGGRKSAPLPAHPERHAIISAASHRWPESLPGARLSAARGGERLCSADEPGWTKDEMMATLDWGSVADWVSGLGSISASVIALYLAGSDRRARQAAERPHVSFDFDDAHEGWARFMLRMENPSAKQWTLEAIEVISPGEGALVREIDTVAAESFDDPKLDPALRDKLARRSLTPLLDIMPLGTERGVFGIGGRPNVTRDRFYVSLPSACRRLRLRLRFMSSEPIPERYTVEADRTVNSDGRIA